MMEERSTLVRLAPFTGLVFVVLTMLGGVMGFWGVGWMAPGEEIASYFEDNTGLVWAGSGIMMIAPLFLLWFVGSLWQRMRVVEGSPARLSVIMFGGGVAMAAAHLAGASMVVAAAGRASERGLSPDYAALSYDVASIMWSVAAAIALAALLLSFGILSLRRATYPPWWGWVSVVVGVALLIVPISWMAMFAGLIWIAAMSMWLGTEGWRTAPPPAA